MFGSKNKKLEEWFKALPEELRGKLEASPPDEWARLLVEILGKKKLGRKESRKDGELEQALVLVRDYGAASSNLLQRKMGIDKSRADSLLKGLEEGGYIGPVSDAMFREVYDTQNKSEIDETVLQNIFDYLLKEGSITTMILERQFKLDERLAYFVLEALEKVGLITSRHEASSRAHSS